MRNLRWVVPGLLAATMGISAQADTLREAIAQDYSENLAELLVLVEKGLISNKIAKTVFDQM